MSAMTGSWSLLRGHFHRMHAFSTLSSIPMAARTHTWSNLLAVPVAEKNVKAFLRGCRSRKVSRIPILVRVDATQAGLDTYLPVHRSKTRLVKELKSPSTIRLHPLSSHRCHHIIMHNISINFSRKVAGGVPNRFCHIIALQASTDAII